MIRSLIGLPFRVGAHCAGVAAHTAAGVADRALGLAGRASRSLGGAAAPDVDLDGSPHDGASARRRGPRSNEAMRTAPGPQCQARAARPKVVTSAAGA